tara:strand:+ start:386 stop:550 length:165 start_codon:yes stop_codon:yes gene_type:complete
MITNGKLVLAFIISSVNNTKGAKMKNLKYSGKKLKVVTAETRHITETIRSNNIM